EGELLGVDRDTAFVLPLDGRLYPVPLSATGGAKLAFYDSRRSEIGMWAFLGSALTISNGYFAIFTLPAHLIAGTVAWSRASHRPIRHVKQPSDWDNVRMYSRFPAGVPQSLPRTLPTKPYAP